MHRCQPITIQIGTKSIKKRHYRDTKRKKKDNMKKIGIVESFGNCYILFLKVCVHMADLHSTSSIIFIRLDEIMVRVHYYDLVSK